MLDTPLTASGEAVEGTSRLALVREFSRGRLGWLLPLLPWAWYLFRGLHPAIEFVAIALPIVTLLFALAVLLAAAFWRRWDLLALCVSTAVFFVFSILLAGRPVDRPEPTETIRIASINMAQQWFANNDLEFFSSRHEPDVLVGTELSGSHDDTLRKVFASGVSDLLGSAPNPLPPAGIPEVHGTYKSLDFPSIGVYSTFELELLSDPIADEIEGGLPGLRVLVHSDQGDYVLYALHIPRPSLSPGDVYEVGVSEQRRIVEAIARAAESETLPVLIVGDLNVVDRGTSYDLLTDNLQDAMREERWAGPTQGRTIWHALLFLRIDHLLIDNQLCAGASPLSPEVLFTDHDPILADIGPCAAI